MRRARPAVACRPRNGGHGVGRRQGQRQKGTLILRCLLDGMSMRATGRTAEVAKQTVANLFQDAAMFAYKSQDRLPKHPLQAVGA